MGHGNSSIGRLALKRKFDQTRPKNGESINVFFDTLLGYYNRMQGTPEETSEETLKAHIYTHVPPEFRATVVVLQHKTDVSVEQVMDSLREDEDTRRSYNIFKSKNEITTSSEEALTTQVSQKGTYDWRTSTTQILGRSGQYGCLFTPTHSYQSS